MPSIEERMSAVEQAIVETRAFHQELARRAQENDENLTILLGVIRHQGQDIRSIKERLDAMDGRFDAIDGRLDGQSRELVSHTMLLQQILAKLS